MHLGKSYTISEFTFWSRRQLYASLACGSLPVVLYQFPGLKWLSIPVSVVVLLGTAIHRGFPERADLQQGLGSTADLD
jgi:putative membrane protein